MYRACLVRPICPWNRHRRCEKRTGSWGSVVRREDALSSHGGSMMSDNGTCDEEWRLSRDRRGRRNRERVVKKEDVLRGETGAGMGVD
jgi:hypothetical protein